MSCTIISTPETGASSWVDFITQQGLTDRGFMQISLTNFASTAASLVGTGSVFELAGSIYSCSGAEAIGLATGTASAAVAVYYVAIPSAGGTTCTFTMDSVAPTRVDAKQGYYASAASTSRYLGGAYIGTAATYYDKWLYQDRYSEKPRLRNTGIKIGSFDRSTSGNQVITGVGFQPSVIIFGVADATATNANLSVGFADSTTSVCVYINDDGTAGGRQTTYSIYIRRDGSNVLQGSISAISADGFTIAWLTAGTVSLSGLYLALP